MRTQRIKDSSNQLDELEVKWWNEHAETVEKIWALSYQLQKVIRLPYLKKMKSFFMSGSQKLPVKVLEIGCGSGWVCRMLADDGFHVIGTDFSTEQLSIAREQAKAHNKEKYCKYELADASSIPVGIDAVVIHALLHHLSSNELTLFFEQLSKLPSSTKVFLYEPVFLGRGGDRPLLRDKILYRTLNIFKKYTMKRVIKKGILDADLFAKMENIYSNASSNGWYISPKEVPFYEDELENYLLPLFKVRKKYIVNKTDLEVAQALMMYKIENPDFVFKKVLIPILSWLDKSFFKGNHTFYTSSLTHHFVCFELVRR